MTRRAWVLLFLVGGGAGSIWAQERGYVLKRGEGESLLGGSRIIKASPRTGSQGAEMIWDSMAVDRSTGIHAHKDADEFFYVLSGSGSAFVVGNEQPVEAGDVIFVAKGQEHRIRNARADAPLELVFLVDRPGLATEFREGAARSQALGRPLTLEERNSISQKHGTTYKTIE
jgi:mannose-6-phosphate isomerase-like protein (cupin superfamily)